MSPIEDFGPMPERLRTEAGDWFARMRGPDAEAWRPAFEIWIADPYHARAYEQLAGRWEQSAFIHATATGRGRKLSRAPWIARHLAWAAAAALLVCVSGAALMVPLLGPDRTRDATVARAARRLETGASLRQVALSDGSHVILDQASLLLVSYSPTSRDLVLERGRARFNVAHDPSRPFVVDAGPSRITAHGTMFDVALAQGAATVTLFKGKVSVRVHRPGAPERSLLPGQRIVISATSAPAPVSAPSDADGWLPRMVDLDSAPLADAVARVGRGSTIRVVLGAGVGDLRITGAFRAGDVIALAQAAAAMFDLAIETLPNGDVRLTRPLAAPVQKNGG